MGRGSLFDIPVTRDRIHRTSGKRDGRRPGLDANELAVLTRSIVETRGWPTEAAKEAFFAAGYGTGEYLEVIVGVTVKTLSNYVNHAADTPLDPAFEAAKWAA